MNNNKLIVFDVEGLVTYPGFREHLHDPVYRKRFPGTIFGYWSLASGQRSMAEQVTQITNNRLGNFFITEEIRRIMEQAFQAQDMTLLQEMCSIAMMLPLYGDNDAYVRLMEEGRSWVEATFKDRGRSYKKQPALAAVFYGVNPTNTLIIESDSTYTLDWGERGRELKSDRKYAQYPAVMAEAGVSTILVPEYPFEWHANDVAPEVVMQTAGEIVRRWKGGTISHDLGVELGMYPEGFRALPEGRPRRFLV